MTERTASASRDKAAGRLSTADWLAFGLEALGDGGPGAIRLDDMCTRLGVTKGSFYWHFAGREAFLADVLNAWATRETDAIIDRVEARGGGPVEKLRALYAESASPAIDFAPELAIRQWARRDSAAADAVRQVDARRIAYTEALYRAAGVSAAEATVRADILYAAILSLGLIRRDETKGAREARRAALLDYLVGPAPDDRRNR